MINIGLINCDPLTPEVIEKFGDYPKMFSNLFNTVTSQLSWTVYYANQGQLPTNIYDCDVYLISGSRFGVLDNDQWIISLISFIQKLWEAQVKTIGICFGHQAMAHAMGGTVNRAPNGWRLGVVETTIIEPKAWMNPYQSQFQIHVSHQDQVLVLPPESQCLAKTVHCPNAIITMGNTFLSFQGHPEFNHAYTQSLIYKRQSLFDKTSYESFLQSLSLSTDNELLAKWMMHFIAD